jgi:hypothetical protein
MTELETFLRSPWPAPRDTARRLVATLAAMTPADRRRAAAALLERRADEAHAVRIALAVDDLTTLAVELDADGWADSIALGLTDCSSLGVVSIGAATRAVAGAVIALRAEPVDLLADRAAVVKGLEDLDAEVRVGDPATADTGLVPVKAVGGGRVWTSQAGADLLERSHRPTLVVDPLVELSARETEWFRPAGWLVAVETAGGRAP